MKLLSTRFLCSPMSVALLALLLAGGSPVTFADNAAPDKREIVSFTRGPASSNLVALTFDDGPHPKLTPRLLDILEAEGITATFFLLGVQVKQNPELARRIVEQGHEIANHSHTHANLARVGRATLEREIGGTQNLIEETTGVRPWLFRAPYGSVSGTVREALLDTDLELVGWAIDPRDWEKGQTSEKITAFILERTAGGDIVLLHDIHERSIDAVIPVIRGLKAKGYEFTTAGELITQRRAEMEREAELAAAGLLTPARSAGSGGSVTTPAEPPRVPLGRSTLKRYDAKTPARSVDAPPSP